MEQGHTILLVEDDSDTAKSLTELFRMVSWNTIVASTLDEFRARLRDGGYCLGIHDLEIPASSESIKAHVDAGMLGIQEHRDAFPRANETGMHFMPLLCMSAFAKEHRSSRRARRAGVDDAVVKPLDDNDEPLLDTIKRLLRESGREDHARCREVTSCARREATVPPPHVAPKAGVNRLAIKGTPARGQKGRTELVVNGTPTNMTNKSFLVLLRLIEGQVRGAEAVTAKELDSRDGDNFRWAAEVQKELKPYLLPKSKVYSSVRALGYALADGVVVESIDLDALAKHDERSVQKVAEAIAKHQKTAAQKR